MKKILCLALAAVVAVSPICTFADFSSEPLEISTDYSENITTVTINVGQRYAFRRANVIILNPGFLQSDLAAKTANAVNWATQAEIGAEGFVSARLALKPLEEDNNPVYTAIVGIDTFSAPLIKTFELYNQNYVNNIYSQILSAMAAENPSGIMSVIEQYPGLLGVSGSREYDKYLTYGGEEKNRAMLGLIKERPENVGSFKEAFLADINIIALDECSSDEDYETAVLPLISGAKKSVLDELESLNDVKKADLIAFLMAKEFNCKTDIIDELYNYFVLSGINNAELWTETAALYAKYADVLEISTADYNSLKDKQTPMTQLIGKNFLSIAAAGAAYKNAVAAQKQKEGTQSGGSPSGGGGGGGGGGSVFGANSNKFTVVSDNQSIGSNQTGQNASGNKPQAEFSDIAGYDWAKAPINALKNMGIINGYENNKFLPEKKITRAEFVNIFVSAFKISGGNADISFSDVNKGDWFYESVMAACAAGYINGTGSGSFEPNSFISREDMAVILARYLGMEYDFTMRFSDAENISPYAKGAVAQLCRKGIINGYEDNTFRPKSNTLRAEAAVLIAGILKEKGAL